MLEWLLIFIFFYTLIIIKKKFDVVVVVHLTVYLFCHTKSIDDGTSLRLCWRCILLPNLRLSSWTLAHFVVKKARPMHLMVFLFLHLNRKTNKIKTQLSSFDHRKKCICWQWWWFNSKRNAHNHWLFHFLIARPNEEFFYEKKCVLFLKACVNNYKILWLVITPSSLTITQISSLFASIVVYFYPIVWKNSICSTSTSPTASCKLICLSNDNNIFQNVECECYLDASLFVRGSLSSRQNVQRQRRKKKEKMINCSISYWKFVSLFLSLDENDDFSKTKERTGKKTIKKNKN